MEVKTLPRLPRGGKKTQNVNPEASGSRPRQPPSTPPLPERRPVYGEEPDIVEVDDTPWVAAANNMVGAILDLRNDLNPLHTAMQNGFNVLAVQQREYHRQNMMMMSALIESMDGTVPQEVEEIVATAERNRRQKERRKRRRLDVWAAETEQFMRYEPMPYENDGKQIEEEREWDEESDEM
jgi:hypothetical protein